MVNYKVSLLNQKVLDVTQPDTHRKQNHNYYKIILLIVFGVGCMFGNILYKPIQKKTALIPSINCQKCHTRQMAMTIYMKNAGVKSPEKMAEAVLKTNNPKLLAAVHIKGEKCTPYWAKNTGYKNEHSGAWQMNERYHGKQPNAPIGQALNAERYLISLTKQMPIVEALNTFGGESDVKRGKYAFMVLPELKRVP